jgi:ribosome-binding protein aMBF1 (putative translation factor)
MCEYENECCEMCGVETTEETQRYWYDDDDTEILYCEECYDRMIERKKKD